MASAGVFGSGKVVDDADEAAGTVFFWVGTATGDWAMGIAAVFDDDGALEPGVVVVLAESVWGAAASNDPSSIALSIALCPGRACRNRLLIVPGSRAPACGRRMPPDGRDTPPRGILGPGR